MNREHDTSHLSLMELFIGEVESQTGILTAGILDLERSPEPIQLLQALMRAAHSLKGAARIVNVQAAVRVAHAMEDCFVAAQTNRLKLARPGIDVLLRSIDLLAQLGKRSEKEIASWEADCAGDIARCLAELKNLVTKEKRDVPTESPTAPPAATKHRPDQHPGVAPWQATPLATTKAEASDRMVRLTADSLNRLLGLAGESLVESRWLRPFTDSLQRLKRHHLDLSDSLQTLRQDLERQGLPEHARAHLENLFRDLAQSRRFLTDRLQELEMFDRRSAQLSHRLYLEVLRTRMRPFGDGARRFPRMVRDLARSLGKEVRLEISGESTQVDRDILERLETPIAHMLRNAVDHGCESPTDRSRAGKPTECIIRLDARHSAGMLIVSVGDDGSGVDCERLRKEVVSKGLVRPAVAENLTESDLLEFLFLPGFTLRDVVSEISGRGVGLDVVQNMVRSVRGAIRVSNQFRRGLKLQLQLPLTLSVLRALLIEVDGEPYALPLNQIQRTLKISRQSLESLEGRYHFQLGTHQIGLVSAHQLLDCGRPDPAQQTLPVVVLGERSARYGVLVDQFLGERELVVQPLDPRLGKVADISAAALMEDGTPVLIIDVDELLKSLERLVTSDNADPDPAPGPQNATTIQKRVLAVDDSSPVRELQRRLLTSHGYLTDVAADGVEAWKLLANTHYDLVITDVDMPHMSGIDLITLMKKEPRLQNVPVLMVSYKDRENDRFLGLNAGADFYLGKGSFQEETLLEAVRHLLEGP